MAYQFIHVEGYARSAGKGKTGGHTVGAIIAEAERRPDACPHVASPKPPTLLYGVPPSRVAEAATLWAESAKDSRGHKLRKDGLCMLGGVVSVPAGFEDWPGFRTRTVEWLRKEYGDQLVSVVEHTDEAHPHLHFYAVPWQSDRFDSVHPGLRASAEADPDRGRRNRTPAEKEAGRKAARLAFSEAMRSFQDRFFRGVGAVHGMARIGPKRRRLSRAEWRAEEQQRKAQAALVAQADQSLKQVREERQAFEAFEAGRPKLPGIFRGKSAAQIDQIWAALPDALALAEAREAGRRATQARPDGKSHGKGR